MALRAVSGDTWYWLARVERAWILSPTCNLPSAIFPQHQRRFVDIWASLN